MSESGASFQIGTYTELHIKRYESAALSVPALSERTRLQEKDLLASGTEHPQIGKYSLEEHLAHLQAQDMLARDRPLLLLGLRNSLVNLRAPVIYQGQALAVEGEDPLASERPYYGLGLRGGRLTLDTALGATGALDAWPEFFCAGVPILWDGISGDALFDLMLSETSDHSHIFYLPRGNHPQATDRTRAAWQQLHDAFTKHLKSSLDETVQAMHQALNQMDPPLERADDYLHAAVAQKPNGDLGCFFANARLETLGHAAARRGYTRAVCVENSGSVMPTYLPTGMDGGAIPLLRAPNFRPKGRAVLVIELGSGSFESLPYSP